MEGTALATPAHLNHQWPHQALPDLALPPGMRREDFRAMGTTISLLLPTHAAAVGCVMARSLFTVWEDTLSRFRPESELSTLNRQAGSEVIVSPLLYGVVAAALDAAQATDGLFD